MHTQTPDVVAEEYIPVEEAALSLRLSPRKLKRLLVQRGLPLYLFGTRTQRIRAGDLQLLVRSAVKQTEVA